MNKKLRILLLSLTTLLLPAANAIDMNCFPGEFKYDRRYGYRCEFDTAGTQCLVCYAVIVVEG